MRFIACAYRDWAVKVTAALSGFFPEHQLELAQNPKEFEQIVLGSQLPDAVFSIGWSWLFDRTVVDGTWVVGIHPSDLPSFAGGSPIQNQILAGITETKNTLFRLTPALDGGPILGKLPLSLEGHLDEIFERLTTTSIVLLADFIRAFPNAVVSAPQAPATPTRRLRPESGRLEFADFPRMRVRQLYDVIRCREDPYPNAFVEDDTGRLLFKRVEFLPKVE